MTWELAGKYPNILEDEKVGEAATDLFADAQKMLHKIADEKLLNPVCMGSALQPSGFGRH